MPREILTREQKYEMQEQELDELAIEIEKLLADEPDEVDDND